MASTQDPAKRGPHRRDLLVGAASFLTITGLPLRAQPAPKPRICYLSFRAGPNEFEQAFVQGLRDFGYVDGANLVIDYRWAAFDPERVKQQLPEVLSLRPRVVVIADAGWGTAVRAARPDLPIVVTAMADPVAQGITTSLSRPDGNVTGVSVFATELSRKRLELLREAVPGLRRVAALFNVRRTGGPPIGVAVSMTAGRDLGLDLVEMPLALPDGIEAGFAAAARDGIQGVAVVSDTSTIAHRDALNDAARTHRLPTIYANRTYLKSKDGGFMSYGPDLEGAFRRSAFFVDRILRGARPEELPIEQPERFELVLGRRAAKAIGVSFPQSLQLRADAIVD